MRTRWWRSPAVVPVVARIGTGAAGTVLVVTGAVAVFTTTNSTGASTLIIAGTVLIIVAIFANQVESFEGGGVKVQLRAVETKLEQARQAEAAGDSERAEQLRKEAQLLFEAIQPMAAEYERVRRSTPGGMERTAKMNELVWQARSMAGLDFVTTETISELFGSGGDGARIMALGLMRGRPELADVAIAVEAIREPRSSHEQWQALRLCQQILERGVSDEDRVAILGAIAFAESEGTLATGSDTSRLELATAIREGR